MYVQSKVDFTTRGHVVFAGLATTGELEAVTGPLGRLDKKYDMPQRVNSLWSRPLLATSDDTVNAKADKPAKSNEGSAATKANTKSDGGSKGSWGCSKIKVEVDLGPVKVEGTLEKK